MARSHQAQTLSPTSRRRSVAGLGRTAHWSLLDTPACRRVRPRVARPRWRRQAKPPPRACRRTSPLLGLSHLEARRPLDEVRPIGNPVPACFPCSKGLCIPVGKATTTAVVRGSVAADDGERPDTEQRVLDADDRATFESGLDLLPALHEPAMEDGR